jgi:hypothetical protein
MNVDRVKYRDVVLSCGADLRQVFINEDEPQRPRDFDVEGNWPVMVKEIALDSRENFCQAYTAHESEPGLWSVWRGWT